MNHVLLQILMYFQCIEIKFNSPKTHLESKVQQRHKFIIMFILVYIKSAVRRLARIFDFRNHIKIPAEQLRPAGRWLFINAVQCSEPLVCHFNYFTFLVKQAECQTPKVASKSNQISSLVT
jgi:hypothetical protein